MEHETELHLFAESSCQPYWVVPYLWTVTQEVNNNVSFVTGKSRLPKLKAKGISRQKLEIQAKVIATRLKKGKLIIEYNYRCFKNIFWK